jgi:hypothetical protein
MTGRHAIASHQQRIETVFSRAGGLNADPELLADFSKYLCILVAGFIEKSFSEIALEHARRCGAPSLQNFVERNTSKFTNANASKIVQFLGAFDSDWRSRIENYLVDEKKDAVDSIYGLRNNIAHGVSVGITYARMKDYYAEVKSLIVFAQDLCIPE